MRDIRRGQRSRSSGNQRSLRFAAPLLAAALLAGASPPAAAPAAPSGSPARSAAAPDREARHRPSRSAVLFIGDGMGPSCVTVTRVATGGSAGRLHLDDMPYTALVRTWSAEGPVTDSAAAATAMACGRKTMNGVLGQDSTAVYGKTDGQRLESIALWARKRGVRVGLVTTTRVTHATPAGFYASTNDRDRERDIARQAIASPVDLLLGGGRGEFGTAPPSSDEVGWRPDDREDLEAAARARGWVIAGSAADLGALTRLDHPILGLFAPSHLPYEARAAGAQQRHGAPTLEQMTRFAVRMLSGSGAPFFLMVEGGRIDHAGHANWARTLIDETAAFDASIGAALTLLDPKTTLVLVTADHDTGSLALNGYPAEKDGILGSVSDEEGQGSHPVLTFASGPGAGSDPAEAPYGAEDRRPSGITLGSAAHTGIDVALYAWGAGAERVHGTLDNTAVYELLRAHLEGRSNARDDLTRPPR